MMIRLKWIPLLLVAIAACPISASGDTPKPGKSLLDDGSAEGAEVGRTEAVFARCSITAADAEAVLGRVEVLRDKLRRHVDSLRKAGRDPAYPLVTLTVLENFIGYSRDDLAHDELARAHEAAVTMEAMARRALGREFLPPVPRYRTASRGPGFRLDGPAQLGTVRWPDGRIESDRPLQFVGVGHFSQVKRDIEKLNHYGCNIIQIEFGPRSVVRPDGKIATETIEKYLKYFDRAAKANVAVNLLVSPHYFPDWAYRKWPHLKDGGGGFLKYDVHAPEARAVLEKFLRTAIPRIAHHPALHSICLSNEPVFTKVQKSRFVRERWHRWLRDEHGTIDRLNRRWESDHAEFESVPVPPTEFRPAPIVYDFIRFNREAFAEFHAWMASIIHDCAPNLPVHAKIMICANFRRHAHGPWSVSPELFAELSDFNGNDAWKNLRSREPWANNWVEENMGYDFQRSMADKPVFNSENHLIPDRNFDHVPPEHITNVFWQGAIHGQSATTTWVWERTYSRTSDVAGSIIHRPGCVEAMGHAGLDLMRLSEEVAALQKVPIELALLWSPASLVAGQEYLTALRRMYEGLNFCGVRLGFVSERQLAVCARSGKLPPPLDRVKLILATYVTHTPEATITALEKFRGKGGRVVYVGECFIHDEYGRKRNDPPRSVEPPANAREAFDFVQRQISTWKLIRPVELQTSEGKPVWGVEYLPARHRGRWLVNLCNYCRRPQELHVVMDGKPVGGNDLLSGRVVGPKIELPPLGPILLELRD